MAIPTQASRRRRSNQVLASAQGIIRQQVSASRREEIRRYLELFGYKPDRTILQVHVVGSFGRGVKAPKEIAEREKAAARYGGRTFVVVGRRHDPEFVKWLIAPRKKSEEASPGYVGYLFNGKDKDGKSPDELLPLDFVPASLNYPRDWKAAFGNSGYLITMHIPTDFAKSKNELNRRLRRIRGDVDAKKAWKFLDEIQEFGYQNVVKRQV